MKRALRCMIALLGCCSGRRAGFARRTGVVLRPGLAGAERDARRGGAWLDGRG